MNRGWYRIVIGVWLVLVATSLLAAPVTRWQLPKKLTEASGLALSQDGRIFLHNDEKGIVYQIDLESGDVDTVFKISDPALRADFEAIAIIDHDFFLITSRGELHWIPHSLDYRKQVVASSLIETGLGEVCEVEGLSSYSAELYIVCKTNYHEPDKHHLLVFKFNPQDRVLTEFLRIPHDDLDLKKFHASGIAITRDIIYIISAKKRRLLLVTRNGKPIGWHKLDKNRHRQVEGISVAPNGAIYLVDEGKSNGGILSIYASEADL